MITTFADHVWQSTLVALMLGALASTLRHHAARLRYALWFFASIKFLVPFSLLVAVGQQLGMDALPAAPAKPIVATTLAVADSAEWGALMGRIARPASAVAPRGPFATTDIVRAWPRIDLAELLLFGWAAGAVAMLGVWLMRWRQLAAVVRRSRLVAGGLFDNTGLEVRVADARIEPGVVGIMRPLLLLPDGIAAMLTSPQLRTVIEHELCHVRRHDNLTAAMHMFVEVLFWFHPVVWWIGARLVDERERACDEAVLARAHDPQTYAEAIIAVCEVCLRSPLKCAAGIGGATTLRERIERLLSSPSVRSLGAIRRCALGAAMAALIGVPLAIGVLNAPPVRAQSALARASAPTRVQGDPPGLWIVGPRINASDISLRDVVAFAFHLPKAQIFGPQGFDSPHYTIVAELPVFDTQASDLGEQYRAYVRTLLEQRFDLAFHRETRVVPALSLVSGAWSAGLKPSNEDRMQWFGRGPPPCGPVAGCALGPLRNLIEGRGAPIGLMVDFLSDKFGMPILDRTSLAGRYDFVLEWPPEAVQADTQGPPSNEVLRKILEDQLGLKLLAVDAPVERLVIDRIGEPRNVAPAASAIGLDPPPVILREPVRPRVAGAAELDLTIDRHGSMYFGDLNDDAVPLDARSVVAVASAAISRDPDLAVFVYADGMIANHRVVEAASLLQEAGVIRINFATLPFRPNSVLDDSSSLNRAKAGTSEPDRP